MSFTPANPLDNGRVPVEPNDGRPDPPDITTDTYYKKSCGAMLALSGGSPEQQGTLYCDDTPLIPILQTPEQARKDESQVRAVEPLRIMYDLHPYSIYAYEASFGEYKILSPVRYFNYWVDLELRYGHTEICPKIGHPAFVAHLADVCDCPHSEISHSVTHSVWEAIGVCCAETKYTTISCLHYGAVSDVPAVYDRHPVVEHVPYFEDKSAFYKYVEVAYKNGVAIYKGNKEETDQKRTGTICGVDVPVASFRTPGRQSYEYITMPLLGDTLSFLPATEHGVRTLAATFSLSAHFEQALTAQQGIGFSFALDGITQEAAHCYDIGLQCAVSASAADFEAHGLAEIICTLRAEYFGETLTTEFIAADINYLAIHLTNQPWFEEHLTGLLSTFSFDMGNVDVLLWGSENYLAVEQSASGYALNVDGLQRLSIGYAENYSLDFYISSNMGAPMATHAAYASSDLCARFTLSSAISFLYGIVQEIPAVLVTDTLQLHILGSDTQTIGTYLDYTLNFAEYINYSPQNYPAVGYTDSTNPALLDVGLSLRYCSGVIAPADGIIVAAGEVSIFGGDTQTIGTSLARDILFAALPTYDRFSITNLCDTAYSQPGLFTVDLSLSNLKGVISPEDGIVADGWRMEISGFTAQTIGTTVSRNISIQAISGFYTVADYEAAHVVEQQNAVLAVGLALGNLTGNVSFEQGTSTTSVRLDIFGSDLLAKGHSSPYALVLTDYLPLLRQSVGKSASASYCLNGAYSLETLLYLKGAVGHTEEVIENYHMAIFGSDTLAIGCSGDYRIDGYFNTIYVTQNQYGAAFTIAQDAAQFAPILPVEFLATVPPDMYTANPASHMSMSGSDILTVGSDGDYALRGYPSAIYSHQILFGINHTVENLSGTIQQKPMAVFLAEAALDTYTTNVVRRFSIFGDDILAAGCSGDYSLGVYVEIHSVAAFVSQVHVDEPLLGTLSTGMSQEFIGTLDESNPAASLPPNWMCVQGSDILATGGSGPYSFSYFDIFVAIPAYAPAHTFGELQPITELQNVLGYDLNRYAVLAETYHVSDDMPAVAAVITDRANFAADTQLFGMDDPFGVHDLNMPAWEEIITGVSEHWPKYGPINLMFPGYTQPFVWGWNGTAIPKTLAFIYKDTRHLTEKYIENFAHVVMPEPALFSCRRDVSIDFDGITPAYMFQLAAVDHNYNDAWFLWNDTPMLLDSTVTSPTGVLGQHINSPSYGIIVDISYAVSEKDNKIFLDIVGSDILVPEYANSYILKLVNNSYPLSRPNSAWAATQLSGPYYPEHTYFSGLITSVAHAVSNPSGMYAGIFGNDALSIGFSNKYEIFCNTFGEFSVTDKQATYYAPQEASFCLELGGLTHSGVVQTVTAVGDRDNREYFGIFGSNRLTIAADGNYTLNYISDFAGTDTVGQNISHLTGELSLQFGFSLFGILQEHGGITVQPDIDLSIYGPDALAIASSSPYALLTVPFASQQILSDNVHVIDHEQGILSCSGMFALPATMFEAATSEVNKFSLEIYGSDTLTIGHSAPYALLGACSWEAMQYPAKAHAVLQEHPKMELFMFTVPGGVSVAISAYSYRHSTLDILGSDTLTIGTSGDYDMIPGGMFGFSPPALDWNTHTVSHEHGAAGGWAQPNLLAAVVTACECALFPGAVGLSIYGPNVLAIGASQGYDMLATAFSRDGWLAWPNVHEIVSDVAQLSVEIPALHLAGNIEPVIATKYVYEKMVIIGDDHLSVGSSGDYLLDNGQSSLAFTVNDATVDVVVQLFGLQSCGHSLPMLGAVPEIFSASENYRFSIYGSDVLSIGMSGDYEMVAIIQGMSGDNKYGNSAFYAENIVTVLGSPSVTEFFADESIAATPVSELTSLIITGNDTMTIGTSGDYGLRGGVSNYQAASLTKNAYAIENYSALLGTMAAITFDAATYDYCLATTVASGHIRITGADRIAIGFSIPEDLYQVRGYDAAPGFTGEIHFVLQETAKLSPGTDVIYLEAAETYDLPAYYLDTPEVRDMEIQHFGSPEHLLIKYDCGSRATVQFDGLITTTEIIFGDNLSPLGVLGNISKVQQLGIIGNVYDFSLTALLKGMSSIYKNYPLLMETGVVAGWGYAATGEAAKFTCGKNAAPTVSGVILNSHSNTWIDNWAKYDVQKFFWDVTKSINYTAAYANYGESTYLELREGFSFLADAHEVGAGAETSMEIFGSNILSIGGSSDYLVKYSEQIFGATVQNFAAYIPHLFGSLQINEISFDGGVVVDYASASVPDVGMRIDGRDIATIGWNVDENMSMYQQYVSTAASAVGGAYAQEMPLNASLSVQIFMPISAAMQDVRHIADSEFALRIRGNDSLTIGTANQYGLFFAAHDIGDVPIQNYAFAGWQYVGMLCVTHRIAQEAVEWGGYTGESIRSFMYISGNKTLSVGGSLPYEMLFGTSELEQRFGYAAYERHLAVTLAVLGGSVGLSGNQVAVELETGVFTDISLAVSGSDILATGYSSQYAMQFGMNIFASAALTQEVHISAGYPVIFDNSALQLLLPALEQNIGVAIDKPFDFYIFGENELTAGYSLPYLLSVINLAEITSSDTAHLVPEYVAILDNQPLPFCLDATYTEINGIQIPDFGLKIYGSDILSVSGSGTYLLAQGVSYSATPLSDEHLIGELWNVSVVPSFPATISESASVEMLWHGLEIDGSGWLAIANSLPYSLTVRDYVGSTPSYKIAEIIPALVGRLSLSDTFQNDAIIAKIIGLQSDHLAGIGSTPTTAHAAIGEIPLLQTVLFSAWAGDNILAEAGEFVADTWLPEYAHVEISVASGIPAEFYLSTDGLSFFADVLPTEAAFDFVSSTLNAQLLEIPYQEFATFAYVKSIAPFVTDLNEEQVIVVESPPVLIPQLNNDFGMGVTLQDQKVLWFCCSDHMTPYLCGQLGQPVQDAWVLADGFYCAPSHVIPDWWGRIGFSQVLYGYDSTGIPKLPDSLYKGFTAWAWRSTSGICFAELEIKFGVMACGTHKTSFDGIRLDSNVVTVDYNFLDNYIAGWYPTKHFDFTNASYAEHPTPMGICERVREFMAYCSMGAINEVAYACTMPSCEYNGSVGYEVSSQLFGFVNCEVGYITHVVMTFDAYAIEFGLQVTEDEQLLRPQTNWDFAHAAVLQDQLIGYSCMWRRINTPFADPSDGCHLWFPADELTVTSAYSIFESPAFTFEAHLMFTYSAVDDKEHLVIPFNATYWYGHTYERPNGDFTWEIDVVTHLIAKQDCEHLVIPFNATYWYGHTYERPNGWYADYAYPITTQQYATNFCFESIHLWFKGYAFTEMPVTQGTILVPAIGQYTAVVLQEQAFGYIQPCFCLYELNPLTRNPFPTDMVDGVQSAETGPDITPIVAPNLAVDIAFIAGQEFGWTMGCEKYPTEFSGIVVDINWSGISQLPITPQFRFNNTTILTDQQGGPLVYTPFKSEFTGVVLDVLEVTQQDILIPQLNWDFKHGFQLESVLLAERPGPQLNWHCNMWADALNAVYWALPRPNMIFIPMIPELDFWFDFADDSRFAMSFIF